MSLAEAFGRAVLVVALLCLVGWGSGALWFRGPRTPWRRITLIAGWWLLALATLWRVFAGMGTWPVMLPVAGFAAAFAALVAWWLGVRPQRDREWAADVGRLLATHVYGDHVTLHNVRNFDWRSREDFTPRWETREYDLSQLTSVDLVASHWMGPTIAHTLVSFGFTDGRQLVFSVEVRRTRGEEFSALGGFFKQCELALVAADEHDIVRTRSNVRDEKVYLYRVALPAADLRPLFMAYLGEADKLHRQPRFYHTLFSNCTTLVYDLVKPIVPGLPWDIRLILCGYLPGYLYDLNALDTSRPLAELIERGHINARARAADDTDAEGEAASRVFSRAIRRGVPAPDGRLIEPEIEPEAAA